MHRNGNLKRQGQVFVAIWLTVACAFVLKAWPALAQANALSDKVSALEQKAGLPILPEQSLIDRVTAVESKVFGSKQTGSLVERVHRITAKLFPDLVAEPLPVTAGASDVPEAPPEVKSLTELSPSTVGSVPSQGSSPPKEQSSTSQNSVAILELFPPNNTAPPHFLRIPPPGKNDKLAEDYYSDVMKATKNKIFRYKAMPVSVYITPYPDRRFTEACIKGFENWEERTNGVVRFTQIEEALKARIRVIWSHLGVATDANDCTLGAHTVTKWKTKAPGKVSMMSVGAVPVPIYIPTLGPKVSVQPQVIEVNLDLIAIKDEEIRMFVLQNIVTHELGHALGLLGHSQERSDMMYPVTDENSRLSARDINTLLKIYEMKADIPL